MARAMPPAFPMPKPLLIGAGSWIPPLTILGIFAVRYARGVARALEFEIAQDRNVQLVS